MGLTPSSHGFEDRVIEERSMDTQSLATLATPFLVFGGVFVVLLLVWERE